MLSPYFSDCSVKAEIAVIDKQLVVSSGNVGITGLTNVNVTESIAVNVGECDAGTPDAGARYPCLVCNVFELKISSIEIKFIVGLIAGEVHVQQTIVIDIANGYAGAIVKITICVRIESFGISKGRCEM